MTFLLRSTRAQHAQKEKFLPPLIINNGIIRLNDININKVPLQNFSFYSFLSRLEPESLVGIEISALYADISNSDHELSGVFE